LRRYIKNSILSLLSSINEAHEFIIREFASGDTGFIKYLLADCHDAALQISNIIEQSEGKEAKPVQHIEEYIKMLNKISMEKIDNTLKEEINTLNNQINRIYNCIRDEIAEKLEVVFLPYKASMWDSLESIWLAAKEDKNCDAYVVPIPYFSRHSDGSFDKMYYEGSLFPDYVPVVNYVAYNIEKRQPDIIFIHNPYDDTNIITSVHPDYYSEKLKKYTDLLVYVPYFVTSGNVSEHFCSCPGVINAHKVFVQSEEVRHTYIKVSLTLLSNSGKFGHNDMLYNKFLATGSPKFDKVINSKVEEFILPDDWIALIRSKDGINKKIVLYNTTINAILKGNEKYIYKLKDVLNVFRKRDDIVLWWRPHPLNEATYKSMRPHLLQAYIDIVDEYKNEGWGIYDDSPDLHRSIAMSSMYYGDRSSLVAMYQCTGKPILIQNIEYYESSNATENTSQQQIESYLQKSMELIEDGKRANDYNFREMPEIGFGISEFLDLLVRDDFSLRFGQYLNRQKQIRKNEIASPDGKAGYRIYEICRNHLLNNQ